MFFKYEKWHKLYCKCHATLRQTPKEQGNHSFSKNDWTHTMDIAQWTGQIRTMLFWSVQFHRGRSGLEMGREREREGERKRKKWQISVSVTRKVTHWQMIESDWWVGGFGSFKLSGLRRPLWGDDIQAETSMSKEASITKIAWQGLLVRVDSPM